MALKTFLLAVICLLPMTLADPFFVALNPTGAKMVPPQVQNASTRSFGYYRYDTDSKLLNMSLWVSGASSLVTAIEVRCNTTHNYTCIDIGTDGKFVGTLTDPDTISLFEMGEAFVVVRTQQHPFGELRDSVADVVGNPSVSRPPNMEVIMEAAPGFTTDNYGLAFLWFSNSSSGSGSLGYIIMHTISTAESGTIEFAVGTEGTTGTPMKIQGISNPLAGIVAGTKSNLAGGGTEDNGQTALWTVSNQQLQVHVNSAIRSPEIMGQAFPITEDGYPVPRIPRSSVAPLTAVASATVRGSRAAMLTFGVVLPTNTPGNEIRVRLPTEYELHDGGHTQVIWPVGFTQPQSIAFRYPNEIHMRVGSLTVYEKTQIRFTLTNIKLPFLCEDHMFTLSTMTCSVQPLLGSSISAHQCEPNANDYNVTAAIGGIPAGCGLCDSCEYMYSSSGGESIYQCYYKGAQYTRAISGAFNQGCNVNTAIASCGGNPTNLAVGCVGVL